MIAIRDILPRMSECALVAPLIRLVGKIVHEQIKGLKKSASVVANIDNEILDSIRLDLAESFFYRVIDAPESLTVKMPIFSPGSVL